MLKKRMIKKSLVVWILSLSLITNGHTDKPVYLKESFNGHVYELVPTPLPWHVAKRRAEDAGGYLVVITSKEENDFVKGLIEKSTNGEFCSTWIGFTDEENEGDWKWVNGEKATFNFWFSSQPDNWGGWENAAHFVKNENGIHWNDNSSGCRFVYIIEYNQSSDTEDQRPVRSNKPRGLRSTQ